MNPMTNARRRQNRAYWESLMAQYPFHAQSPTLNPSPTDVMRDLGDNFDGWFIAVPMGNETTFWGFGHFANRDAFLSAYPQATELAVEVVYAGLPKEKTK